MLAAVSVATRRRWTEIAVVGSRGVRRGTVFAVTCSPARPASRSGSTSSSASRSPLAPCSGGACTSAPAVSCMWTLRHRAETRRGRAGVPGRPGAGATSAPGSPARCTTCSPTGSRRSPCTPARSPSARTSPPSEVHISATVIQDKAHEALTDLRGVLGVLRDERRRTDASRRSRRTPTCGQLVAEAREGGHATWRTTTGSATPTRCRTRSAARSYRIVQEGITNARKHAPGAAARASS